MIATQGRHFKRHYVLQLENFCPETLFLQENENLHHLSVLEYKTFYHLLNHSSIMKSQLEIFIPQYFV